MPAARPAKGTEMRPRLLNGIVACSLMALLLSHTNLTGLLVVTLIGSAFLRLTTLMLASLAALICLAAFQALGVMGVITLCAFILGVWFLRPKKSF